MSLGYGQDDAFLTKSYPTSLVEGRKKKGKKKPGGETDHPPILAYHKVLPAYVLPLLIP